MALYLGGAIWGHCTVGGGYVTCYSVFECDLYHNGFQLCSFIGHTLQTKIQCILTSKSRGWQRHTQKQMMCLILCLMATKSTQFVVALW